MFSCVHLWDKTLATFDLSVVVLVVVFMVLGMALEQVEVVASHYCDRNHPQDHHNRIARIVRNEDT